MPAPRSEVTSRVFLHYAPRPVRPRPVLARLRPVRSGPVRLRPVRLRPVPVPAPSVPVRKGRAPSRPPSVRLLYTEQAMPTLYLYPACSTCRNAQKWLREQGVAVDVVNLVETPPTAEMLADLQQRASLPIAKFFNVSGESYRSGGFKDRLPTMDDAQKREALAADGMLIKRPILDLGDRVLVGFRATDWEIVVQGRAGV